MGRANVKARAAARSVRTRARIVARWNAREGTVSVPTVLVQMLGLRTSHRPLEEVTFFGSFRIRVSVAVVSYLDSWLSFVSMPGVM